MRNYNQLNDAHMTPPSSSFPHTTLQVPWRLANRSTLVVRRRESSQGACASMRFIGFNANFVRCLDSRLRGNDEI